MVDEKDRFGDKLRQKEKAEEDRFFAERDKALIEKMRQQRAADPGACPRCGERLVAHTHDGVTIEECPRDHGVWLEHSDLEAIAGREAVSWLRHVASRRHGR
jgi:Transcription factor zinc-finger